MSASQLDKSNDKNREAQPPTNSSINNPDESPSGSTAIREIKKTTVLESHGYDLGKTIGNGSYATVRIAHSIRHNSDVAIKIISKLSAPNDYLKKFLPREIEVVKGLKHSNLIRFLQAIETTHRVYIIMEYASNGSLLDIITNDQYIDERRSRKWFKQLISAIDYCHERGVVHRDIKCENLLMDNDWNVKLSDFGFARGQMKPKPGQPPILSETFCGSYAYASPEILRGIPYQPQFADIWSIGVVLFAMVFGRLPFDDSDCKELIKQVMNKVTFPKQPKISAECKSLINKMLAPLKNRIRIDGIKIDPWFMFSDQKVSEEENKLSNSKERRRSSLEEDELDTKAGTLQSSNKKEEEEMPMQIITKEQLRSKSKRRERRNSEKEEQAIKTEEPIADADNDELQ